MIMLLLLSLLVAALLALLLKSQRLALCLFLIMLTVFFAAGSGPVVNLLLKPLQKEEYYAPPIFHEKNLIVILGAGNTKSPYNKDTFESKTFAFTRLYQGLRLYHACKNLKKLCYVLVSGGDPKKIGQSEGETLKQELVAVGVPTEDIIVENMSHNTFQNAKMSSPIIQNLSPDQIIIVTSGTHMTRALKLFQFFGIHASPSASDRFFSEGGAWPRSLHYFFTDRVLHERLGLLQFRIYNQLGWND